MAGDPLIGTHRIVFSTDLPYATAVGEVKRIADWPLADDERSAVYGGNLSRLLGID
jgi:predicted TIM-barrel fold metal-dependent hydrolase